MSIAFPGYVPDVHAADALDPAWGNAIRDRAPQVFTTQATLTAGVTVPQVGQSAVLTVGTGAFTLQAAPGLYVYAGATDGWRPPWNLPWGPVAPVAQATANQATISAIVDLTSLSVTFTAIANRRYKVTANVLIVGTTLGDTFGLTLADAANTVLQLRNGGTGPTAATQIPVTLTLDTVTPAVAGSYTFKLRLARAAGSGTFTSLAGATFPAQLTVEDIGPAGAPA